MFDFDAYLADRCQRVNAVLDREMPAESVAPAELHRAMRYCVFPAGKRLRPVLVLAAAEAVGGAIEPALFPAAAVEILHSYTLVHDDLPCMDDDDERRGKPSCHVAFGEANAVLVGDALQALAFEIVSRTPVTPPRSVAELVAELGEVAGSRGVVGGQFEDIAIERSDTPLTAEQIEYVHEYKTAALFRTSVRLGALTAGAGAEPLAALTEYGLCLGLAFQVADDLLDARSPGGEAEKASCVAIYGEAGAKERALALAERAAAALEGFAPAAVEPLARLARFAADRTH